MKKGGSHLCASNYCARYRPSARQPHDAGLGSSHIGFRTARDWPGNRNGHYANREPAIVWSSVRPTYESNYKASSLCSVRGPGKIDPVLESACVLRS